MLERLPDLIIAVGALGTASAGLVDVSKAFGGGVSNHGFARIEKTVRALYAKAPARLDLPLILSALRANWLNGVPLGEQILTAEKLVGPPESCDEVTAVTLSAAYQDADQSYRNAAKAWAVLVALVLAVIGGWLVLWSQKESVPSLGDYLASPELLQALLAGLLATPLAPISKDLASALGAAVKTMQLMRGGRP